MRYEQRSTALTLIAVIIPHLAPMAGVVAVNRISRLTLLDESAVGVEDVGGRRVGVLTIIEEDGNVLRLEAMNVLEVLDHVENVVVAAG